MIPGNDGPAVNTSKYRYYLVLNTGVWHEKNQTTNSLLKWLDILNL